MNSSTLPGVSLKLKVNYNLAAQRVWEKFFLVDCGDEISEKMSRVGFNNLVGWLMKNSSSNLSVLSEKQKTGKICLNELVSIPCIPK